MTQTNHENHNHVETLQSIGRYSNKNYERGVNHHTMCNLISIVNEKNVEKIIVK